MSKAKDCVFFRIIVTSMIMILMMAMVMMMIKHHKKVALHSTSIESN